MDYINVIYRENVENINKWNIFLGCYKEKYVYFNLCVCIFKDYCFFKMCWIILYI